MPPTILKRGNPQQYISISLSSVVFSEQVNLLNYYRQKTKVSKQSIALMAMGLYDISTININSRLKPLFDLQNIYLEKGTINQRYYYGRIIGYSESLELNKIVEEKPLVGVSFLKFKKELLLYYKNDPEEFYFDLTNKILNVTKDVTALVCLGFGVEDFIIIFFSNSFEKIKKTVCMLRALSVKDVFLQRNKFEKSFRSYNKIKHMMSATYTIPMMYVIPEKEGMDNKKYVVDIKKVENHSLTGMIQARLLPGHLNYASKVLKKHNITGITSVMEKNDILICPKSKRMRSFLGEYIDIINELLEEPPKKNGIRKQTPVISTETTIGLYIDNIPKKDEPRENSRFLKRKSIYVSSGDDESVFENIQKAKCLPKHTTGAIITMLEDMKLLLYNSVVKDSLISLYGAYKIMAGKISREFNSFIRDVKYEVAYMNPTELSFHDETNSLLDLLYLCFLHRYPSDFAVGEQTALPMTPYKTALQQYLNIVDFASDAIYNQSLRCAKRFGKKISKVNFYCYLGNSPSPWIQNFHYYPIAIINIPTECLYNIPKRLHFIGHEVGHTFVNQFELNDFLNEIKDKIFEFEVKAGRIPTVADSKANDWKITIKECLSDLFECQVLFRGDLEKFAAMSYDMTKDIIGNDTKFLEEHTFRTILLQILQQACENVMNVDSIGKLMNISSVYGLKLPEPMEPFRILSEVLVKHLGNSSSSELKMLFDIFLDIPQRAKKNTNADDDFLNQFSRMLIHGKQSEDWDSKYDFCSLMTWTHREALRKFTPDCLINN